MEELAVVAVKSTAFSSIPGAGMLSGRQELVLSVPQLYYVNGSIPSWRVHMALYEKVCSLLQPLPSRRHLTNPSGH